MGFLPFGPIYDCERRENALAPSKRIRRFVWNPPPDSIVSISIYSKKRGPMQQPKLLPPSVATTFVKLFVTTLAVAGVAMAQTAPAQPPFALGHANAKVLVGIDLKSLRESH